MFHLAWALRLLGVALMASVALGLASRDHFLDDASRGPQLSWCAFSEYGAHSDNSEDLGDLERATLEPSVDDGATINIPVNVFMLGDRETQSKLNLTSPVVRLEENLAYGYSGLGYSFGPFNTYHIYDQEFAEFPFNTFISSTLLKMTWRLRTGGAETLNIYLVPKMTPGLLAFALFPQQLTKNNPNALALDGIIFNHNTMRHYLSEKTMIHELGHWLGLMHPFQGGCLMDGDGVPDTPQMELKMNHQLCVEGKDSCPGLPGTDLVRNYMTYSACTKNLTFTPGQISKMRRSWYQYRNPSTRQLPPSTNQTLRAVPDVWGNTTIDPFAPSVQGEKQGKVDYAKISGGSGSTSTLIRTHTSNARHQTPGFRQLGRAFGWMRSSN